MYFGAAPGEAKEAEKALRELAGRLRASLWLVQFYDVFARLHPVRRQADVVVAANDLDAWYRNLHGTVNDDQVASIYEWQARISKKLGIEQRVQVMSAGLISSAEEVYGSTVERTD
jgi:hypothetical protein